VRFEAVVIPDSEFESLADEVLAGEVYKDERLVPLRITRALHVARPTLVVRTAQTHTHTCTSVHIADRTPRN